MESITIEEINRLRIQNKKLNDLIEWKNTELKRCESMLRVSKKTTEQLGESLERVFNLIDKITELEPVEVLKELQDESKVLESYKRYKSLG